MEGETEQFISLIFARKALWNKTLKQYRNRGITDKLWQEVANELGGEITADAVKKKWRSLRDTFVKELKKVPEGRSGDPGPSNYDVCTAWPHFESMLFIKYYVKPRKAGGNLSVGGSGRMDMTDDDLHPAEDFDEANDIIPDVIDVEGDVPTPPQKNTRKGAQQQLIAIEAQKLKLLEKKINKSNANDDEDEAFFKSLLPHVRKLKPEQKLEFRMDVQKLVQEHVYDKNRFLNDPNSNYPNQLFTPTRNPSRQLNDINPIELTPLSSGSAYHRPSAIPNQPEIVTIEYQTDTANNPPTRQYYSVITSPISSAASQQ